MDPSNPLFKYIVVGALFTAMFGGFLFILPLFILYISNTLNLNIPNVNQTNRLFLIVGAGAVLMNSGGLVFILFALITGDNIPLSVLLLVIILGVGLGLILTKKAYSVYVVRPQARHLWDINQTNKENT